MLCSHAAINPCVGNLMKIFGFLSINLAARNSGYIAICLEINHKVQVAFISQKEGSYCWEAEKWKYYSFQSSSPKNFSHVHSNINHFTYFIIIAINSKALGREVLLCCIENWGAFVHWEENTLCFQWENYTHATHCALRIRIKSVVVFDGIKEKLI